jgi:hypothetical protein
MNECCRVYDAIVEDKSHHAPVRKYVSHMLADYITTATVTAAPQVGGHQAEVRQ